MHPYDKKDDLIRTDAFRAPLASAFKLHLEDVLAFEDKERSVMKRSIKSEVYVVK